MRRDFSIPRLVCLCASLLAFGAGTVAADGFRVVAVEVRGRTASPRTPSGR